VVFHSSSCENIVDKALALKEYQTEHDPTFFTQITQRYLHMAESVSSNTFNAIQGIETTLIAKFLDVYGDTAFMCRYRQCPRFTDGFETAKRRQQHEILHSKRLKCADVNCEFYISGFSTKSALQAHNRKYHAKTGLVAIPKIITRLPTTLDEDAPKPATLTPTTPIPPIHPLQHLNPNKAQLYQEQQQQMGCK
jgi:hypothetical protein